MKQVKIQYAKTHLSALLASVEQGQEVVIARGDQPVARLVPINEAEERDLGFVPYSIPQTFFDPLPDDELAEWEAGA